MHQSSGTNLSEWLLSHSQHNARQINRDYLTTGHARTNVMVRLHKTCNAICQTYTRVNLGRSIDPLPPAKHAPAESLCFDQLYVIYKSGSAENISYFQNHLEQYLSRVFPQKLLFLPDDPSLAYARYTQFYYLYLAVLD